MRSVGSCSPHGTAALCDPAALCAATGRWQEAMELLRQTLDPDPIDRNAHDNLGVVLQPTLHAAHLSLGGCHRDQGDAAAAAAALRQALALDPGDAVARPG